MKSTVQVEILLPLKDGEAYLVEALRSLVQQEYTHWNLAILDGGSTDLSESICRAFEKRDHRITFHSFPGTHPTKRINDFILAAPPDKTKYIAFMHADDVAAPQRILAQVSHLEKHGELRLLGTGTHFFVHEKQLPAVHQYSGYSAYPMGPENIRRRMPFFWCFSLPSIMFHRSIVAADRLTFDEELQFCGDYAWFFHVADRYPTDNLREPLLSYRHHHASDGPLNKDALDQENRQLRLRLLKTRFPRLETGDIAVLGAICFEPEMTLVRDKMTVRDIRRILRRIASEDQEYESLIDEYLGKMKHTRFAHICLGNRLEYENAGEALTGMLVRLLTAIIPKRLHTRFIARPLLYVDTKLRP